MIHQQKKKVTIGPENQSQQPYKSIFIAELPFILKNAIDQVDLRTIASSASITQDAFVYVILQNELFIWSLEKPQNCDRLLLPDDNINENQIAIIKNSTNDQISAFCCTGSGLIRYWVNTSKPNLTQEISLDGYNNNNIEIYITECHPFGIVVGNSQGLIHLVSIRQGTLSIKRINKSSSLLSYFSKPSPVLTVLPTSSSQLSNTLSPGQRGLYVLTESSLIKYEFSNNTNEQIKLDYQYNNEYSRAFSGIKDIKSNGAYLQTIIDINNQDRIEIINILLYTVDITPKSNISRVTFYILKIEILNNIVQEVKRVENFSPKFDVPTNEIKTIKDSKLYSKDSKYYLFWNGKLYYISSSIENKAKMEMVLGSGVVEDHLYLLNLEGGVFNFDIKPFNNDLHVKKERSKEEKLLNQTILFDLLQPPEDITNLNLNLIFKTLNSISLKQQNKIIQNLEQCSQIQDFESIIKQVSKIILDQQPKSKFWAEDNKVLSNLSTEVSTQLKQQLEDKMNRHSFLLQCLNENDFPRGNNKNETQDYLKRNELKIQTAIDLREYQTTFASDLLSNLISTLVTERIPNWNNMGLNIYELFFSNISSIDQLLISVTNRLEQNSRDNKLDSIIKFKELVESSNIFYKLIKRFPIESYVYQVAKKESTHTQLEKIINQINSFLLNDFPTTPLNLLVKESSITSTPIDVQLFDILYDLNEAFLSSLELIDEDEFRLCRTKYITTFVSSNKFQQALSLATQFKDYFSIINIYINDKAHKQSQLLNLYKSFEPLLVAHNQQNLESLYTYMLDKSLHTELLQMPNEFNDSIATFLKRFPKLSWIQCIKMKNFSKSSEILLSNSNNEENLSKKKLFLSLSKLTLLSTGKYNEPKLSEIDGHLNTVNAQKHYLRQEGNGIKTQGNEALPIEILIQKILDKKDGKSTYEKVHISFGVISDSNNTIQEQKKSTLYTQLLSLSLNNDVFLSIQSHTVRDEQFDSDLKNTDFYKSAIEIPVGFQGIILEVMKDYFTRETSQLKPQQKNHIETCLTRLYELLNSAMRQK